MKNALGMDMNNEPFFLQKPNTVLTISIKILEPFLLLFSNFGTISLKIFKLWDMTLPQYRH